MLSARGLSLIALVLLFALPLHSTTITGTIRLPNRDSFNGYVEFQLIYPGQDTVNNTVVTTQGFRYRVIAGSLVPRSPATVINLAGNDTISPANTIYLTRFYDNFNQFIMAEGFSITGSSFDIGTANPSPITSQYVAVLDLLGLRSIQATNITGTTITGVTLVGTTLNLGATGVLATTAQSGTGSLCMTTNCAMTTPTITSPTINGKITQGNGLKIQTFGATCTTGSADGNVCGTTYTWTAPFPDANYKVFCMLGGTITNSPAISSADTFTTAHFQLNIEATSANAASASAVTCMGVEFQ